MTKRPKLKQTSPRAPATSLENKDISPDPLLMPPWPTVGCSQEEAQERRCYEQAWAAFRRGDFSECRSQGRSLVGSATTEEIRLRAHALLERLKVDPLALAVAGGAFVLLITTLVVTYV